MTIQRYFCEPDTETSYSVGDKIEYTVYRVFRSRKLAEFIRKIVWVTFERRKYQK